MGFKYEVWVVVIKVGVFVVFGLEGVVSIFDNVVKVVRDIGYFILVKVLGGGGGMGM